MIEVVTTWNFNGAERGGMTINYLTINKFTAVTGKFSAKTSSAVLEAFSGG